MKLSEFKKFFVNEEKGLVGLLVTILLLIFVVYPLAGSGIIGKLPENILITISVIMALISINVFKDKKGLIFIFAVIVFSFNLINIFTDNIIIKDLHQIGKTGFYFTITLFVLKKVFKSENVNRFTIVGSIVVYLLFGLMWGTLYSFCYINIPHCYNFENIPVPNSDLTSEFIYYSFITLTTVGYGDITPAIPFTRSLAIFEGLIGQLYPVVMIGTIISMRVERKSSGK
ncbi:MAG TPA: potassium channel family protein [Ignavibacteria bacterium]|nr:potassium channel family protein [Ignavibacteria bacterium]